MGLLRPVPGAPIPATDALMSCTHSPSPAPATLSSLALPCLSPLPLRAPPLHNPFHYSSGAPPPLHFLCSIHPWPSRALTVTHLPHWVSSLAPASFSSPGPPRTSHRGLDVRPAGPPSSPLSSHVSLRTCLRLQPSPTRPPSPPCHRCLQLTSTHSPVLFPPRPSSANSTPAPPIL